MPTGYAGTSHEPTWTTIQVAEFLGIARKTVYNLVSLGKLPHRKQGSLNAFIPSEIAAYRAQVLGLAETEKPGAGPPGQNIQKGN